jgi:hypothetical protein
MLQTATGVRPVESVIEILSKRLARAVVPRLFVLELNAGRIHSMNTDGSDRKTPHPARASRGS